MNDKIKHILLEKNIPHVVTVKNNSGEIEHLDYEDSSININNVIDGMSDLNRNGILLLDIKVGKNAEGITKISSIESAGFYKDNQLLKEPVFDDIHLPESEIVPFKSDSWALGEFIIRHKTGKGIPRKFLKSQTLLDKFCGDDEILRKLLIIDYNKREFIWNLQKKETQQCSIM